MSDLTVVARLLAKIDKDGPLPKWAPFLGPCWIWAGKPKAEGYGTFTVERRPEYAHRASYVIHRGPIPDGLVIDHLCRVRICPRTRGEAMSCALTLTQQIVVDLSLAAVMLLARPLTEGEASDA